MAVVVQLVLLAVGFVLLVKGADWFVEGAGKLAEKFGIPQLVIGLTIVAMGTSSRSRYRNQRYAMRFPSSLR